MFRDLRTSTKLWLLCGAFLFSVGVPTYALVVEKRIAIDFARKELAGSRYLAAIREVYARTLIALTNAEVSDTSPDRLLRPLVDQQVSVGGVLPPPELAQALGAAFRGVWLPRPQAGETVDARVGEVLSRARALAMRTGDDSNLTLDPDLDTYYLQNIVVHRLPLFLERLCELHGFWRNRTGASDESFEIFESLLGSVANELKDSLAAAYRGNPDGALQRSVHAKFTQMSASTDAYLKTIKAARADAVSVGAVAPDILRPAIEDTLAAWRVAHVELDRLLQVRIDTFSGRMHFSLSLVSAFLAVSLLIAVLTHRGIVRPLERLEAVASAVRVSKDYSLRAEHGGRDEIGRVTMAVNEMLAELATARTRETAEQSQFARVTRLTAMGEMAASIAHEVNQPLTAIVANSNAGLRWLAHTPPEMKRLEGTLQSIVRDGHRASQVITSIRAMVKRDAPEMAPVDVASAIHDVLDLLWVELQSANVSVEVSCPDEAPPVRANHVQLQQLLSNLMMNAIDAMHRVVDRPRTLRVQAEYSGPESAVIAVEDSGPGIDAKDRERIFDAFFTTKSSGLGLGLAICRSIAESHGGQLWASPNVPHGTIFHVRLPLALASPA